MGWRQPTLRPPRSLRRQRPECRSISAGPAPAGFASCLLLKCCELLRHDRRCSRRPRSVLRPATAPTPTHPFTDDDSTSFKPCSEMSASPPSMVCPTLSVRAISRPAATATSLRRCLLSTFPSNSFHQPERLRAGTVCTPPLSLTNLLRQKWAAP